MKKLSLSMLLALSACGPKEEAAKILSNAAEAPMLSVSGQPEGTACPAFSGQYSLQTTKDDGEGTTVEVTRSISITSREEKGKYSYSLGDEMGFQPADGQPRRIETARGKGQVRVACDTDSVEITAQEDGKPAETMKYVAVGESQIRVEATGSAAALNGTYTQDKNSP